MSPGPVPSAGPQGYLQQGPVFSAVSDLQTPRGLAESIIQLRRENQRLMDEIERLKSQLTDLRKDVNDARESVQRSERACESTQRDLAATRGQLEERQQQMQHVVERMQADERTQLKELDQVVGLMQTTLRKYQEFSHDKTRDSSR